jgi:hypothetical protein
VPGCAGVGDGGRLHPPTCGDLDGDFVIDVAGPGGRRRNYSGDLIGAVACLADVGTDGCGFEMPLEAMHEALMPGRNPGFRRPGADLAVVFVTDEDDCSTFAGNLFLDPDATVSSALGPRTSFRCFEFGVTCDAVPDPRAPGPRTGCTPRDDSAYLYGVDRYLARLGELEDEGGAVMLALLAGRFDRETRAVEVVDDGGVPTLAPSCRTGPVQAGVGPPIRLDAVIEAMAPRAARAALCDADLRPAMAPIATRIRERRPAACLDRRLADQAPDLPGLQHRCRGVDRRFVSLGGTSAELELPPCSLGGDGDCWSLVTAPLLCPDAPDQLHAEIRRVTPAPPGTEAAITCLTDA